MRAARKSTHRLVKRKTLAREPIDREMGLLARKYPAFAKVYRAFYDQASDRGAELPPKYKALVGLGILAFRGAEQSLVKYIRRAYALGATPAEIIGAFEAAADPGGAPVLLHGLRALLRAQVLKRR